MIDEKHLKPIKMNMYYTFEYSTYKFIMQYNVIRNFECTVNSKINGTSSTKGVYLLISKLNSILIIPNLLAHNNLLR